MPLEIAGVVLDKLVSIEASEGARLARHAVPGLSGEYVQDFGRPSVLTVDMPPSGGIIVHGEAVEIA